MKNVKGGPKKMSKETVKDMKRNLAIEDAQDRDWRRGQCRELVDSDDSA